MLSLTIRQNEFVATDFDWLAMLDGVEQFGGWRTSAKSFYFNSPMETFGLRGDNVTMTLDNLMVQFGTAIPEPSTFLLAVLGLLGLLSSVRRRRK